MKPIIVAELSGNHNGSFETALKLVEAAAWAGAHAIKLQTYTPDSMCLPGYSAGPWGGDLYDLYTKAQTPWEWHEPMFNRARELGMLAFSTPFSVEAVDFLEGLNVPFHKIASFEIGDHRLIRKAASTGKPVIISTGMASQEEISDAISVAGEPILLKCTSTYPARDSNLLTIPHMRDWSGCRVGLSDHTKGIAAPVAAVALGAVMIEKHLALSWDTVDGFFSLNPVEFRAMTRACENAYKELGTISYGDGDSQQFKRSLFVVKDIEEGEQFSHDNLKALRPNLGIHPRYYEGLIGRNAPRALKVGPLTWDAP